MPSASTAAAPAAPRGPTGGTSTPLHVVVCLFGVIQRSVRVTWPSVATHVIDHLRRHHFRVSVFVYSLDIDFDRVKVDGCLLNATDLQLIPYDVLEVERQSEVDALIDSQCLPTLERCPVLKTQNLSRAVRRNALRQMHSEAAIGRFLARTAGQYDLGVVVGPDFYLVHDINLEHVRKAARSPKSVFTTLGYQAGGYTNGYYIGQIRPLARILRRAEDYFASKLRVPRGSGYEKTLEVSFGVYDVWHKTTDQIFFKVRANAALPNYTRPYLFNRGQNRLTAEARKRIKAELGRLEALMAPVGQHCLASVPPACFQQPLASTCPAATVESSARPAPDAARAIVAPLSGTACSDVCQMTRKPSEKRVARPKGRWIRAFNASRI